MERILLAAGDAEHPEAHPDVFVAVDGGSKADAFRLVKDLRAGGKRAQMEQAGRSIKGQLKQADRMGAAKVVILTADEVRVRDMKTGETVSFATLDEAAQTL